MRVLYAQSGGVTSVINASAYGVLDEARKAGMEVFVGIHGVTGILKEHLLKINDMDIEGLKYTPAGAFGSCRRKMKTQEDISKLFDVIEKYKIEYFFYNGGNDSMDTAWRIAQEAKTRGFPLKVIGVPKTIDNDLPYTDHCPGYGSAAKYIAISIMEASLDLRSMYVDSTRVFVMEIMGRHAGWLVAAAGLGWLNGIGADIILFPEVYFNKEKFLERVDEIIRKKGYCSIAVSEGIRYPDGFFVSDMGYTDSFGNRQLGGVGFTIAGMIRSELSLKTHVAIPDYLQRSGRHIASKTDIEEAEMVGRTAVRLALSGVTGVMITIERKSNNPYTVEYGTVELNKVADQTKYLPEEFHDDFEITENFVEYAKPLIEGELFPQFRNGLPKYTIFREVEEQ
ncbi:6-phosphofructokinase [Thermosipho atlanticus]|uniref:Pyrophosphate--fructose 6-phosphate 1-phosphotransferase n=1 Tax=Thermosipho atlanticus DSM 15807 TaxID=1123380 RepID=A0A1M5T4P7_9BACT|nr:6-phosphofructokinase [Thermosipho atlanticus]SHH45719.1 pyrophosphate-dependent phosphofructokinase [Thermosipho atlanticus DSM 15807]